MNGDDWIPELLSCDGVWADVLEAIYDRYMDDFVRNKVRYRGRVVVTRQHPESYGKGFGFWHCISEGVVEDERVPDFDRCKRIGWIKVVIENCNRPEVECWVESRRGQVDHVLWYREEFVVILSERGTHADGGPNAYLLKTAFCTFREHQKQKKRRARDASK